MMRRFTSRHRQRGIICAAAVYSSGGAAPTVSLNTADVLKSSIIGTVYANLQYNTSGVEYSNSGRTDNFSTSRGNWLDTGLASGAWLERTINSGSLLTDPGGGRLQMSTTRTFKVRDTDSGSGIAECDMDIEMWDAASGGNSLDSVVGLVLQADYNDPCPGCCFLPETLVTMGDGSTKPIGDVVVGDVIRTFGGSEKVTGLIIRTHRPMWDMELEDGRVLTLSEDHPVFIQGKGYSCINPEMEYKDLSETDKIELGDHVKMESGVLLKIVDMTRNPYDSTVHSFENSKFYANGILVY